MKDKMSWKKYLYYVTTDGKSKGYQDIETSLLAAEPTKCIFGHNIDTNKTKTIIKTLSLDN